MSKDDPAARELFEALLELPPDARLDGLRQRCGDDVALYRRVERLLDAHERAGDLTAAFSGVVRSYGEVEVGATIGPYRLVDKLGEGGMGTVFLAEQREPLRREVALKVVRGGLGSEKVLARFGAERQTLARMEHPGIARVVDAGSTPEGQPFFVMELVRGLPITQHADHNRLSLRERIELFAQICDAVEHAHQKGVIHRDLKPNNVLVTEGARPIPKVIDFGIAKATEEVAGASLLTLDNQVLGTPAYMSPEQASGAVGDLDTRSDVYSLGAMLYELLTGSPAIQVDPDEGLVAVLRQVAEVDPERPSTRAGTATDASREAATVRRTRPRELQRFLRGDLDRIALKALEKDRDRRYGSARALAEDLRRFLGHEPVEARPPTVTYLARRFVRRHRGLTVGLSLAGIAIVAGTVASFLWALRAEQAAGLADEAKRAAEQEAQVSNEALQFVEDLFAAASASLDNRDEMTVRQVVESARGRLTDRFPADSPAGARVKATLGSVLVGLGDYSAAQERLESAIPVLVAREGEDHPWVLSARVSLGDALRHRNRSEAAADVYREVLTHPEEGLVPPDLAALRGQAELGLGYIRREAEQLDAAEEHFRAALGWMARATSDRTLVADAWIALASCFTLTGRFDESLEALETARSTAGPEAHPLFHARLESTIGNLHGSQGSYEEALTAFERALEWRETVLDDDHPSLVLALANVAGMLGATGDVAGAEERLARAVAIHRVSPGDPFAFARALQNLGNCRYMTGKVEAAVELWREALDIWIGLADQDSRAAASLYFSLAEGYHALGDEALSEEMAELGRMAGATEEE